MQRAVVALVIIALGMHSLQVEHAHHGGSALGDVKVYEDGAHGHTHGHTPSHPPRNAGETFFVVAEHMHTAEKKLFLYTFMAPLLYALIAMMMYGSWVSVLVHMQRTVAYVLTLLNARTRRMASFLLMCFMKGVLHPKTY
jgi:hypothetical protein